MNPIVYNRRGGKHPGPPNADTYHCLFLLLEYTIHAPNSAALVGNEHA